MPYYSLSKCKKSTGWLSGKYVVFQTSMNVHPVPVKMEEHVQMASMVTLVLVRMVTMVMTVETMSNFLSSPSTEKRDNMKLCARLCVHPMVASFNLTNCQHTSSLDKQAFTIFHIWNVTSKWYLKSKSLWGLSELTTINWCLLVWITKRPISTILFSETYLLSCGLLRYFTKWYASLKPQYYLNKCKKHTGWLNGKHVFLADIDECSSTPCQNGGACADGVNGYVCTCQDGYNGDNCENSK